MKYVLIISPLVSESNNISYPLYNIYILYSLLVHIFESSIILSITNQ